MDHELELMELSGTAESIIYKNEENGYTVLRLRDENGEMVTVVGCFPYVAPGESMIINGNWVNHGTHGRQFKAEFAQRLLPTSAAAIYSFLAGGSVKGIGPATARLIVDRFGDKALDVLESSPDKLASIKGISASKAQQMSKSFRSQASVRRIVELVCAHGLRPILALRMYKYYGENAIDYLRENPYILSASHIGGSFAEADTFALELGIESTNRNRISAAVIFELRHNLNNGHCFIPREKLAAATSALINVDEEDAQDSVDMLIESGQLICETVSNCQACYLPEIYEAESDAAQRIARMCSKCFSEKLDLIELIDRLEKTQGLKYAPMQRETLRLALNNQLLVVTGGPGTGKTTTVRAILAMFDKLGMKTLLTAPTGRAAKRMTELTDQEAVTVHRLLGAKFSDDGERVIFTKDEDDTLDCDAIILDECSMVDVCLFDALLRAMKPDTRLIMVGDADQLPSVGPGNVFSSVIRSEVVPTVRLTEIFRQNEGSRIVRNAHMINKGEYPDFAENSGDFFRLRRLQAASSVETITELCVRRLPEKMKIPPQDIQVLSPTRKGEMGTINLNKQLQAVLNPASKEKKEKFFGDCVFREGDRVMQIKNNYDILWSNREMTESGSGIYNGDIGFIVSIDHENESLTIDFDGRLAVYGFDSLLELEHAWAMTVHKSQGSEYRAVILALSSGSQMLMTRGVLYTAVTRAKDLLILVGDDRTACQMIDNFRQSRRYTALRIRLRELCGVS
ncbi:MAG: ATP-dependent RecD-like DNA helicase [Oscillospiraceae bacterium]|nr:ATP-dependent RecD-like DNA helicase [Oscillospiraceae bacterium]